MPSEHHLRKPNFLSRGSVCFQHCLHREKQQQKPLPVTQFNCISSNIFFLSLFFPPLNFPHPMLITNSSNTFFINPVLLASHESSDKIIPHACRAQIKAALWHGASTAHSLARDTRSQHGYTEPRKGLYSVLNISFSFFSNQKPN